MKMFTRQRDENPRQPRKKGQPVDMKYCQHMKQPPFIPKTKVCRKQPCAIAKWDVTSWSRVSIPFLIPKF